ncbi:MAG: hypothetical protein CMH49_01125, partial [Myxococcales bacterium]|nr:hypothetical protein [Myxococcales bacterium]
MFTHVLAFGVRMIVLVTLSTIETNPIIYERHTPLFALRNQLYKSVLNNRLILILYINLIMGLSTQAFAEDYIIPLDSSMLNTVTPDSADPVAYGSSGVLVNEKDKGFWRANGQSKSFVYLYYADAPSILPNFDIGDITEIKFHTRFQDSANDLVNWYMTFYTRCEAEHHDCDAWYRKQITAEPMYSANQEISDHKWIEFSTSGDANGNNQLLFSGFPSSPLGFYNGPSLADLQAPNFKWSDYVPNGANPSNPSVINYADQEVLMFTIATGSGWANGFEGDLDAFTISLSNGDSYTFDFNATQEEFYLGCGAHAKLDQDVWGPYEQAYAQYGLNLDVTPTMFTSDGLSDFSEDYGYWRGETDTVYDATEAILYFNGFPGQFRSDSFTVGDIQSIEYITRKGDVSHNENWHLSIYTVANSSNDCTVDEAGTNYASVWYCHRIQAFPDNADQYLMSANEWTIFSTEYDREGKNQLRFSDNGQGTHQSVNASDAPTWSELTAPNFSWANYPNVMRAGKTGQAVDYSDEPVLGIYLTMGSGWSNNIISDLDGLRIGFTDGTSTYLDINGTGESAPTLGATSTLTINNDVGDCSANVNIAPPSAVDSCGGNQGSFTSANMLLDDGSTLTLNLDAQGNASGIVPVGTHILTWVYQNDAGGPYDSATVDQTIIVVDAEAPSLTAPADLSTATDVDLCSASGLSLGNAVVSDNCAGLGATSNDAPNVFNLGANSVNWTVRDAAGNTQTASQTVTVLDQQAPTLSALAPVNASNDVSACSAVLSLNIPTVTDNCDQNLTASNNFNQSSDASDTYPVGLTNVVWTVTDQGGNSGQTSQNVTVTDNEAPDIVVGAAVTQNNDFGVCEAQVNGLSATVSDNCAGVSVTHTVNGQSTVGADASGIYPVGTTSITWRVTDQAGTFQVKTQEVTVVDNEDPHLSALSDVTVNVSGNLCSAFVNLVAPTFTDNCGTHASTVVNDYNNGSDASGSYAILETQGGQKVSRADQSVNGVVSRSIVITWTGSDAIGNVAAPQSMTLTLNGTDTDGDEFCNDGDNCSEQYNPSQSDIDHDGEGNACDCGDGYAYNGFVSALDQASSLVVSTANGQFTASDATEQAVNQYSELCDDGNQVPGDACTNTCQVGPNMDMINLAG